MKVQLYLRDLSRILLFVFFAVESDNRPPVHTHVVQTIVFVRLRTRVVFVSYFPLAATSQRGQRHRNSSNHFDTLIKTHPISHHGYHDG